MDLLNELDNDFSEVYESETEAVVKQAVPREGNVDTFPDKLAQLIKNSKSNAGAMRSFIMPLAVEIHLWVLDGNPELKVLNQLQRLIQDEILSVYNEVVSNYNKRFPELPNVVSEQEKYVSVVKELEARPDVPELGKLLNKEQMLLVSMTMQTGFHKEYKVDSPVIAELIDQYEVLHALKSDITTYISKKMHTIAPNVCALVGQEVAAALLTYTGGMKELSEIPSCNLASIGKTKHLSHVQQLDTSGVRQKGYIFDCELVQSQPEALQKQALRMICAKLALASRVDYLHHQENTHGSLGATWKEEILDKLNKIQDHPNIANVKPLPIPEDKPKKQRAGRRFRKYKEKFRLSNLRQLQNRVEFGVQEVTSLDIFGEEVGIGMATSSTSIAAASNKNAAKLRKKMKGRVEMANKESAVFFESDERATMSNLSAPSIGVTEYNTDSTKKQEKHTQTNQWYAKHLKK
ncbi:U4/U6-U5 snRNP complex subunit PRP31 Ecym_4449 [Eremothecium cymbalariae DBVPG|uniref:Nop domain-containing protein n=1 Tax=Eremothecium cymbalariae (strain CBS 270.75 / DBVPG 7215 / KCTC 17166 / NRRL Y-17582) TaxID=931890 RepID=G8JTZ1_ERECY|nr:hypothetical protein Ecym_4449 [Eremothecium cymbalariae DBVPG\